MEFLHPAMWHVGLESWQWIHQVAAPCNVIRGSGMTCHWICPNVRHIEILHLVLISTTSPQSTCHSAPVSEILSKSYHPRQKKMTSCRFSRRRISAILDFMDPIMGSLISPGTTSYRSSIDTIALNCLVFWENRVFAFWRQDPMWRISTILDFSGPIIGFLASLCATSYRSSMDIVALNCLLFEKIAFFTFWRRTDRQTNRWTAPMH